MAGEMTVGLGTVELGTDDIKKVTEIDWDGVCATHEVTGVDCGGFEEHIPGIVGATGSMTVVWQDALATGAVTAPHEGSTGDLTINVLNGTIKGPYRKAAIIITSCRIRVSPKGECSATCQFQATGTITRVRPT